MNEQQVEMRYFGLAKSLAGVAREQCEVPRGTTIRELIGTLATQHGDAFRECLIPRGRPALRNVKIYVDDIEIGQAEGLETRLASPNQVTFVVAVSQMGGG